MHAWLFQQRIQTRFNEVFVLLCGVSGSNCVFAISIICKPGVDRRVVDVCARWHLRLNLCMFHIAS